MLLSKSCVYGLRASLYMATRKDRDYIPIREISEDLKISFHFLTKILQQLSSAGLMESFRGPNGGIKLTKQGDRTTLMEVVVAIDGIELFTECALGLPGCGVEKPCPLHDKWAITRDSIRTMLENTTLTEMAKKAREEDLRLSDDTGIRSALGLD